jgi:hypothetical protein
MSTCVVIGAMHTSACSRMQPHEPIRRHGVTEVTRRRRSEQAQEDRDESSPALLAAQQANEQALAVHPVQPTLAAPMPPLSAGY